MADKQDEGGTAGTIADSEAQRRLRYVVALEIQEVMTRHNVGGAIFIASELACAWKFVLPTWAGLRYEGDNGFRVKFSSKTPEGRLLADRTMHLIATMRDMTSNAALIFMNLFDMVEKQLGPGQIEHKRVHFGKMSM
jgi:hypothetical protein